MEHVLFAEHQAILELPQGLELHLGDYLPEALLLLILVHLGIDGRDGLLNQGKCLCQDDVLLGAHCGEEKVEKGATGCDWKAPKAATRLKLNTSRSGQCPDGRLPGFHHGRKMGYNWSKVA